MSKESEILEGLHYTILEKWVANGKVDILPEGMEEYMQHLTAVIGFYNQGLNKTQIIKRLRVTFKLSYHSAKNRYVDGINFFYLDNDVTYDAYMGLYADKLEKLADLATQTATNHNDLKIAGDLFLKAANIRKEIKPKETVPASLFEKPNKIYTIELDALGVHEPINRNELARLIDGMEALEETEKIRIKQDAGLEPKQLFDNNEQEVKD